MGDHGEGVDVWMAHPDLGAVPRQPLPEGFRMRFYREGDLETWLRIQAHDPFFHPTAETFAASMPGYPALLSGRVLFLEDAVGAAVGTVAAWHNDDLLGRTVGQIHWVEIVPPARGRGLGRPLVGAACERLLELGHRQACLSTNTRRIPAINLYAALGFAPLVRSEAERHAWRRVAPFLRAPVRIPQ